MKNAISKIMQNEFKTIKELKQLFSEFLYSLQADDRKSKDIANQIGISEKELFNFLLNEKATPPTLHKLNKFFDFVYQPINLKIA